VFEVEEFRVDLSNSYEKFKIVNKNFKNWMKVILDLKHVEIV